MRVVELWRYPVKSLQGELLDEAVVTATGVADDRAFAIFDADTGLGLTARRAPELLYGRARATPDGVDIELPDGSLARDDAALSRWLGRAVTLRSASAGGRRQYENPLNFEDEGRSEWMRFEGSEGAAFHDSALAQVSIVSTGTIGRWDRRRFRANMLVGGSGEDDLVGARVRAGDAVIEIVKQIPRCVMTTRAQPDGVERDLDVLRVINRQRGGFLAVGALVVQPGVVRVGDELAPV